MSDSALFRSPELVQRDRSRLLVVDVQEKLLPAIAGADAMIRRIRFLLDAAELFSVPTLVSEQYPQGLGSTVTDLAGHPAAQPRFDKVQFSAAEGFCEHFRISSETAPDAQDGRDQLILVGMEAHVCVMQSAMDLIGRGYRVFVAEDAVGSGTWRDHKVGIDRLSAAGAGICTVESIAFEWCEAAGSDEFKSLSRLVRELRAAASVSPSA